MKKHNVIAAVVLVILAALIALSIGFLQDRKAPGAPDVPDGEEPLLEMDHGINLIRFDAYSGMFVEDGSDEAVSGLAAVTVENTGADAVQLMDFSILGSDGTKYEFELTTLFPGEKLMALEKNKAPFKKGTKAVSAELTAYTAFAEAPTMCEDTFEVTGTDGAVTVKNVSEETVSAGRVFYKNVMNGTFIGGITYMTSFTDLGPGEETTLYASRFSEANSRLVFVTYAEQ